MSFYHVLEVRQIFMNQEVKVVETHVDMLHFFHYMIQLFLTY